MRTSFAMLTGMLLFRGAAALSVHRPKPQRMKAQSNGAHVGEDKVMLGGVPVYAYHKALEYARKTNSFKTGGGTEEQDAVATWIVEFKMEHMTAQHLDDLCAGIFAPCNDHGDLTNVTGHMGLPFLVTRKTVADLNDTLKQVDGEVLFAEHDAPMQVSDAHLDYSEHLADDTEAASTWGLNRINKDSAPSSGFGVHAYVLDTGIRVTHSQFEGRAIPQLESLGNRRVCECQNTTCAGDTHGHGTHCAGTVGGTDYGVAPMTKVHAVKVLGDDGYGFTSWSISAHDWIKVHGMRPAVVSMSLGGAGQHQNSLTSIDALVADGIPVVVAAGNQEADACDYSPAWIPSAVTVGSMTDDDHLSYFTNFGSCVDIMAPGSGILSAGRVHDTSTDYKSGTSMACPHVTGAVAILQAMNPSMTPAAIIAELLEEAESGVLGGVNGDPYPADTVNLLLQVDSISG